VWAPSSAEMSLSGQVRDNTKRGNSWLTQARSIRWTGHVIRTGRQEKHAEFW
jgi:hypothetical protein